MKIVFLVLFLVLVGPLGAEEPKLLGIAGQSAAPVAEPAVEGAFVFHGRADLPADVRISGYGMYIRDVGLLGEIRRDVSLRVDRLSDGRWRLQVPRTRYAMLHELPLDTLKISFYRPGHNPAHLEATTDAGSGWLNPSRELERVVRVRVKMGTVVPFKGPEIRLTPIRDDGQELSGMAFVMPAAIPIYRIDLEAAELKPRRN